MPRVKLNNVISNSKDNMASLEPHSPTTADTEDFSIADTQYTHLEIAVMNTIDALKEEMRECLIGKQPSSGRQ